MGYIVIPSEAEESLTISEMEISRDVSASLDMTKAQNLSSADAATAWFVSSTIIAS